MINRKYIKIFDEYNSNKFSILQYATILYIRLKHGTYNKHLFNSIPFNAVKLIQNYLPWVRISDYYSLTENFIREFQHKVDWYRISAYQKLSEDFIKEFQDKVDWYWIFRKQVLSKAFKKEFEYKLND